MHLANSDIATARMEAERVLQMCGWMHYKWGEIDARELLMQIDEGFPGQEK